MSPGLPSTLTSPARRDLHHAGHAHALDLKRIDVAGTTLSTSVTSLIAPIALTLTFIVTRLVGAAPRISSSSLPLAAANYRSSVSSEVGRVQQASTRPSGGGSSGSMW